MTANGGAGLTRLERDADDGTRLTAWCGGQGPLAVALVGPMLGDTDIWAELVAALGPDVRVCTWELRGSTASRDSRPAAVARHAADGWQVLDAAGVEQALLVGWSTGAVVAARMATSAPARTSAYVSICGLWGGPLGRLARRVAAHAADLGPMALATAAALGERLRTPPWLPAGLRAAATVTSLHAVGLVGEHARADGIAEQLARMGRMDPAAVAASWAALLRELGDDPSPAIDAPSLWVAGARDPIAGPMVAGLGASACSNAQQWTVPGGGHFLPLEQPELIALRLRSFAADLPPAGATAS